MKLNTNEHEALSDVLSHDEGMKAVWKLAQSCLAQMHARVLEYNLETGNPEELAYIKCRAEGAARFLDALKARLYPKSPTKTSGAVKR